MRAGFGFFAGYCTLGYVRTATAAKPKTGGGYGSQPVERRPRTSSEGGGVWCRGLESIPFMKLTASVHQRAVRPPKFAKNRCCRSANRRKIGHSCTMFSLLSRAPLITFVHRHEDRLSRVSTPWWSWMEGVITSVQLARSVGRSVLVLKRPS